jgi:hypothetical protein
MGSRGADDEFIVIYADRNFLTDGFEGIGLFNDRRRGGILGIGPGYGPGTRDTDAGIGLMVCMQQAVQAFGCIR